MIGRCIVGGCGNTVRPGISLHQFPLAPGLRRLWNSSVKTTRKDWNAPSQTSAVLILEKTTLILRTMIKSVDPSNDDKVSLRITPQKVRFVRRMLLFTRHPNLASATPPPKVMRLIQNTNAEGYVCSITQRTQGHRVMDA